MSCSFDMFFEPSVSLEIRMGVEMSCQKNIELVQCDTRPNLEFVLKDCQNAGYLQNVSGVDLFLRRVSCGDESCVISNDGHTGLSLVNPSESRWSYSLQSSDTSGAGTYFGDLQITYDDGSRQTASTEIRLTVRKKGCGIC